MASDDYYEIEFSESSWIRGTPPYEKLVKCVNDGIEALRTDELARIEALRTFIFKNDDKFKDSRFTWLYHKTFCYDSVLEEDFLTFIESKR